MGSHTVFPGVGLQSHHLTYKDKSDAHNGKVTRRHIASHGAESPEKNRAVLSRRMPLRRIFYTVLVTYIYLALLC